MTAEQVSAYRNALTTLCQLRAASGGNSGSGWPYMQAVMRLHQAFGCPPEVDDPRNHAARQARKQWFAEVWPKLHASLFLMADSRGCSS